MFKMVQLLVYVISIIEQRNTRRTVPLFARTGSGLLNSFLNYKLQTLFVIQCSSTLLLQSEKMNKQWKLCEIAKIAKFVYFIMLYKKAVSKNA